MSLNASQRMVSEVERIMGDVSSIRMSISALLMRSSAASELLAPSGEASVSMDSGIGAASSSIDVGISEGLTRSGAGFSSMAGGKYGGRGDRRTMPLLLCGLVLYCQLEIDAVDANVANVAKCSNTEWRDQDKL